MTDTWLIGRYQLLKLLGKGGFANTYLAADHQQARASCVIKHLMPINASPQFLQTARRLFQAEVEALRRLGTHDRIPQLIDAFESAGEFYLVQEFIEGDSLSTLFKQQPPLSEAEIIALLKDVLPILGFIHQEQVIHRDIKPSNLMRRQVDGKLMLIDFGAVKEITTEAHTANSEEFTVSIGTQGYAAPEQMAGRPRYSSDLYALGMTVIRGLTGRSPTEFPENPHTGELLWESTAPNVSPGLKVFLQRLTQASVYQRYPSAAVALAELSQYDQLSTTASAEIPETAMLPETAKDEGWPQPWLQRALTPLLMTVVVLLIRQLGGWMPLELLVHDRWTRHQPTLPIDDRLLVVEITENDLKELRQPTPSDAVLAEVIQTLQVHEPQVIGLDLYRDIPQGEGHAELLQALAADNTIAIRQLGAGPADQVPAPPGIPVERVGFNDFPIDTDGVVRRNLLMASTNERPEDEVFYSFALQLALAYLQPRNILPLASDINPNYLELNGTTLRPLHKNFGGYRPVDAAGYQLMLQYRGADQAFLTLSLQDVLKGQFTTAMIRDRIVLIGTTAASAKDFFFTPYSAAADEKFLMPGVMLHAQATSQILAATLDQAPLDWDLPEAVEVGWIVVWVAGGAGLGWSVRRLWVLGVGLIGGVSLLVGISTAVLMAHGWLPLFPASVGFGATAIATVLSRYGQLVRPKPPVAPPRPPQP